MPLNKIALILLIIILLPALLYTGYELTSLSSNERMLAEIYRQQLDTILYSVNQYAWDTVNSWVSRLNVTLTESQKSLNEVLPLFMENNRPIRAILIREMLGERVFFIDSPHDGSFGESNREMLLSHIESHEDVLERLRRMKGVGYRKIEPIAVADSAANDNEMLALLFIPDQNYQHNLAGVVLDTDSFIQQVLAPKLQEVAGQEFVLAVFEQDISNPVFATTPVQVDDIRQQKSLWLFPNHFLGIRPRGETFDDLARSRFYRSLLFIILLDTVLLGGAWVVYRNIKREMELARLKSDFVSNVSHELKTPLSLIRMFAETLEMGRVRSNVKKKEYYQIISRETERLTHLVNNLLNFSRMEAGKKQYQFERVDLNAIVKRVVENYDFHLHEHGFDAKVRLATHLPGIRGDAESIAEALLNLLDNAIKYSKAEKSLAIESGTNNGAVYLEVADSGIGIDPEHQKKIFEKFYRVSSGLVHNTKGSGLGLTLVKHIMDAHGGEVTVSSRLGQGARFRLIFPASTNNPQNDVTNSVRK